MWFDSWSDIARILAVGAAAYVTVVVILRLSGKRTLAKLNAFDWVVSVAFGSTLATILLSSDVSWTEGALAFVVLLVLQLVVSFLSSRWSVFRKGITAEPVVLLEHGELRRDAMTRSRVAESEVMQAVRGSGGGDLANIAAVVLETNGKLSVITTDQYGNGSAMEDVGGAEGL